ncbi:MAG: TRAP transporter small permease [Betaproteobacteria bacterium]|nr:TRAP transporter small permease [Betaproteobacteria bacterium]
MDPLPSPSEAPPRARGALRLLLGAADVVAAATLLALSAVTVIDVFGRYVFNTPIGGADEMTVFLMAVGVYAVLPRISRREEHIAVDIVDLVFPRRWLGLRQALLNALGAAFMAMVTWRMSIVAARMAEGNEVTMFLRLPKGPLAYFFTAMCAIATVMLAWNVVRYLRGRGPLQVPADGHPDRAPGDAPARHD